MVTFLHIACGSICIGEVSDECKIIGDVQSLVEALASARFQMNATYRISAERH